MSLRIMDKLVEHLDDLWDIDESERQKGIKLLHRICGNILTDPSNPKFRDLNFVKIGKKLDQCQPALLLLFDVGFTISTNTQRLQLEANDITINNIRTLQEALSAKQMGQLEPNNVVTKVSAYFECILYQFVSTNIIKNYFCPLQEFKKNGKNGIKVSIPNDMMETALSKHNGHRKKALRWCLSQIYSEITDSVAHSVISALDDAQVVQLNQLCYCQRPLEKYTAGDAGFADLLCRSCWRVQSVSEAYGCDNEQCVFKERMEMEFRICLPCYNTKNEDDDIDMKENEIQTHLFGRKTIESLNKIS